MEENYVRRMIVHHRPRGFVQVEQDQFELFIENLLVKGPVVVAFDVFPSYERQVSVLLIILLHSCYKCYKIYLDMLCNKNTTEFQGIFSPTDVECEMRLYQRFTKHCVVLYGKCVEVKNQKIK